MRGKIMEVLGKQVIEAHGTNDFLLPSSRGSLIIGGRYILFRNTYSSSKYGSCCRNMVLIIHGFFNGTSALRFEWAWQHPHLSRRLKHLPKKKASQRKFDYCLVILSEMLNVGPWSRLPLTVRWLDARFATEYSAMVFPPHHMQICEGKVVARKIRKDSDRQKIVRSMEVKLVNETLEARCALCGATIPEKERIACLMPNCPLVAHLICLAGAFCQDSALVPVEGTCPKCDTRVLWGDLIKKKMGYFGNSEERGKGVALDGFGEAGPI